MTDWKAWRKVRPPNLSRLFDQLDNPHGGYGREDRRQILPIRPSNALLESEVAWIEDAFRIERLLEPRQDYPTCCKLPAK